MFHISQIKGWVAQHFPQATQEVHNFVAWIEQRDSQVESAKAVLLAEGYTVTDPAGKPVTPQ